MNLNYQETQAARPPSFLFFDTETTGLPRNYHAPISDMSNWPRIIQIGWASYDYAGNEISAAEYVIRPDGFVIPQAAANIHGITTQIARERGINMEDALSKFSNAVLPVPILVGHNIEFDENVIGSEFFRHSMSNIIPQKQRMCTMKLSVNFCKLPGSYGYKWPKLNELYRILFHTEMVDSHTALTDVRATASCFFQ